MVYAPFVAVICRLAAALRIGDNMRLAAALRIGDNMRLAAALRIGGEAVE
jgi:hypothetical protein